MPIPLSTEYSVYHVEYSSTVRDLAPTGLRSGVLACIMADKGFTWKALATRLARVCKGTDILSGAKFAGLLQELVTLLPVPCRGDLAQAYFPSAVDAPAEKGPSAARVRDDEAALGGSAAGSDGEGDGDGRGSGSEGDDSDDNSDVPGSGSEGDDGDDSNDGSGSGSEGALHPPDLPGEGRAQGQAQAAAKAEAEAKAKADAEAKAKAAAEAKAKADAEAARTGAGDSRSVASFETPEGKVDASSYCGTCVSTSLCW